MTDEDGVVGRPELPGVGDRGGDGHDRGSESDGESAPAGTDSAPAPAGSDGERQSDRPVYAPPAEESFDWRGWVLVGLVFVCFLVIPGTILLLPAARGFLGSLGLSLRDAYLTLPLIPAVVLGAVAVWSAVASRRP